MSAGELILYRSEDGGARVQLRAVDGTVWLTQAEIAELFQITPQTVTRHIQSIYAEGELDPAATCTEYVQVRSENLRQVRRSLNSYSLDVILAVGYRVRSPRGVQFRQFAEVQAIGRKPMTMTGWIAKLDEFLKVADRDVLSHAGRITHEQARLKAEAEFEKFRSARINAESEVERAFEVAAKRIEKKAKLASQSRDTQRARKGVKR